MRHFRTPKGKKFSYPIFFPDATRGVIRALDSKDVENTRTPGVLVNTFHLYKELGNKVIKRFGGISDFMNWNDAIISDSGGFQVMSMVKRTGGKGKITDEGVAFYPTKKSKMLFTPEISIEFQLLLKTDMIVALDDFTEPDANYKKAKESVERTIHWAKRSKNRYEKITKNKKERPKLIAVVQGGEYQDLRIYCAEELKKIGFDGYGYGGWPINQKGNFDYESAKTIVKSIDEKKIFWGLGIGKPEEIVGCFKIGYNVFDCVLPTRDARHKRLYTYNSDSMDKIRVDKSDFYSYYSPHKQIYSTDTTPVSKACDCLLCRRYSKAYLVHLFRIGDITAQRLSTIHNLRFYSILMEKLRNL